MKRKFITIAIAALLIISLVSLAVMPAMSPDVESGAALGITAMESADMAALDSVVIESNILPAPVPKAGTLMCLALGAILFTLTVAYGRRYLHKFSELGNDSLRGASDSVLEGTGTGGGTNKFILPAAI